MRGEDAVGSRRAEVTVGDADGGMRLDAYLAGAVADLSRSRSKSLILSGHVAVGGATIVEPKRPVKPGETVTVDLPPSAPAEPQAEPIPLSVVYEDDEIIVVNKPAGMVVHPAAGNRTGTLVNALIAHCGPSLSGISGVSRPGIVHRLDRDTSGLMVVAKTERAHKHLAEQFADHGRSGPLERSYKALVWGVPDRRDGTVDANLGRASHNREKIEVKRSGGRRAVTHYRVVERYGAADNAPIAALVECRLETGRTHQIRVHMAALGHPVIGDAAYGAGFRTKAAKLPQPARDLAEGLTRQALHAWLLGFAHPATGETMRFKSVLPADLSTLQKALKSL